MPIRSCLPPASTIRNCRSRALARAYVGPARFNASEAGRRSGYNPTQARETLTKQPGVRAFVEKLCQQLVGKWDVSTRRWLDDVAAIAQSDIRDVVDYNCGVLELKDLSRLLPQVTAAIASIDIRETKAGSRTIKVRMHDKKTALQMLAVSWHPGCRPRGTDRKRLGRAQLPGGACDDRTGVRSRKGR